ncbi:unnamed protein product [Miscanthus lutarioriparius]|uniref:poly(A)-specific ribonuclease n=1 Tax=Miscanthus lutarioriparius TaxID=422564 RepID=A0A811NQZ3_9POAL|nr:unnamed protein product [Miscanthus lutarioriparius]
MVRSNPQVSPKVATRGAPDQDALRPKHDDASGGCHGRRLLGALALALLVLVGDDTLAARAAPVSLVGLLGVRVPAPDARRGVGAGDEAAGAARGGAAGVAHNFDQEAKLIESLLPRFRYVAVDTEFPGTVYRPAGPAYTLKPEERYKLLRSTVDALDPIQLGLTLLDKGCRLPSLGLGDGAPATRGGYDLAYLVKMMFGPGFRMPASAAEFEVVARAALLRRRRVFDVREMARLCPRDDLRGGLDNVAAKLNVARAAGKARQAGYDSLLSCYTFVELREICFDDDGKLTSVDGILAEITAF